MRPLFLFYGLLERHDSYDKNNIIHFNHLEKFFQTNVSWSSFTRVSVTACLFKSSELFHILAVLNNAFVWMISICLLISNSFSSLSDDNDDYYYYHHHHTPWEFFIHPFTNRLSPEFEWHQVTSGFLDSSQHSCRSQRFCCLDGFDSSPEVPFLQSPFQSPKGQFQVYQLQLV